MGDKRITNTIFLLFYVTEAYKLKHHLSWEDFNSLSYKDNIINYIANCPDVFDSMTDDEMVEEVDRYVASY